MYSNKIDLDKFYTKKDVVLKCIKYINFSLYDFVIEPSAGNGSFYNQIKTGVMMKQKKNSLKGCPY